MPTAKKKKSVYTSQGHPYKYEMNLHGKTVTTFVTAKVRPAKSPVTLKLEADHVRRSIVRRGVGSTINCAMAVCSETHADAFPHSFVGIIDWWYSRAFIASKLNSEGRASECYAYEISKKHRKIAKLNDSLGGQQKLLDQIEKNGPITVELEPYRQRSAPGRSGKGRGKTGARSERSHLKGHRARAAECER